MLLGRPFNRRDFFKDIEYNVKNDYGSYKELISLTIRDISELKIGIQSKQQEQDLEKALLGAE